MATVFAPPESADAMSPRAELSPAKPPSIASAAFSMHAFTSRCSAALSGAARTTFS